MRSDKKSRIACLALQPGVAHFTNLLLFFIGALLCMDLACTSQQFCSPFSASYLC
jgi:hypothetical protein